MHPDIEKFWNDSGYEVVHRRPVLKSWVGEWRELFYTMKDNVFVELVGLSEIQYEYTEDILPCTIHLLDGKEYSEEEMLKIIKLKAFI